MPSFSQWYSQSYPAGSSAPDISPIQPGVSPSFRDPLDAARSAFFRRTPDAQYPSGYVGDPQSRRRDRLQGAEPPGRRRPTDRGIHKDGTVDPSDYLWPQEFNTWSGVETQMAGLRFAPPGVVMEATEIEERTAPTEDRMAELRSMAPSWVSGGPQPLHLPAGPASYAR